MDFLKSLLGAITSYCSPMHKESKAQFFDINSFSGLPTEIILSIADFLSIVDLTCLSLCSHRLRDILLGPISRLPYTRYDKLRFLILLERDLPQYFACNICKTLHRFDGSESFGLSGLPKEQTCQLPCVKCRVWFNEPYVFNPHIEFANSFNRLSFLQVKLAMRRFYHGPSFGISTDSLSWTQVRDFTNSKEDTLGMLSLFSIEATISPEPLGFYIRMQDIVVVDKWDHLLLQDSSVDDPVYQIWACRHLHLLNFIAPWIKLILRGGLTETTWYSEGQCERCNVDFHVKVLEFDFKPTVILTRWLSLGTGLTLDDPSWKIHADPYWEVDGEIFGRETNLLPRVCFEATAAQSFSVLNSRNLLQLRGGKYEQTMQFAPGCSPDSPMVWMGFKFRYESQGAWYISYKELLKTNGFIDYLRDLPGRFANRMRRREKETDVQGSPCCRAIDTPFNYAQNTPSEETPTEFSQAATELMELEFIPGNEPFGRYTDFEVYPYHCISLIPCVPFPVPSISRTSIEYPCTRQERRSIEDAIAY